MFLRFESALAGANFSYQPGDVVDWPDEREAQRFVDKGLAEQLSPEAAREAAAASGKIPRRHRSPEKAVAKPAPEKAVA